MTEIYANIERYKFSKEISKFGEGSFLKENCRLTIAHLGVNVKKFELQHAVHLINWDNEDSKDLIAQ